MRTNEQPSGATSTLGTFSPMWDEDEECWVEELAPAHDGSRFITDVWHDQWVATDVRTGAHRGPFATQDEAAIAVDRWAIEDEHETGAHDEEAVPGCVVCDATMAGESPINFAGPLPDPRVRQQAERRQARQASPAGDHLTALRPVWRWVEEYPNLWALHPRVMPTDRVVAAPERYAAAPVRLDGVRIA